MSATQQESVWSRRSIPSLMPMVYDDLTRLARSQLAREYQPSWNLNPQSLVHEAYAKLVNQTDLVAQNRQHLIALVGYAMKQVIIDEARARKAAKRGGGKADLPFEACSNLADTEHGTDLEMEQCLDLLQDHSPRLAQVVKLRFLAGLTEEETAETLHTSVRTVQRDWVNAKAWLKEILADAA